MVFKKKRSIRELVKSALIIIAFFGVPLWIFMIATITGSVWAVVGLFLWETVGVFIMRRFE